MKTIICGLVVIGLVVSLVLTGFALTVEEIANLKMGPERQKILIEGARKEGKLMLYTSSFGLEKFVEEFTKKYPFIRGDTFTTTSNALAERALAEARAGISGGDVLRTNLFIYDKLKDLLVKFNSPGASYNLVPKGAAHDFTGIAFAYSTRRVAPVEIPQKVEDLLLPRWKGKIGLYAPPNNYPGRWVGCLTEFLGEEKTKSFLKKLGEQDPQFFATNAIGRTGLLAGEFDINMQAISYAVQSIVAGEPTGMVALDPTPLSPGIIGLFKKAKNPHSALLFLDWAFGEGLPLVFKIYFSWTPEEVEKRQKGTYKLPKRIRIEQPGDAERIEKWLELFDQLVVKKK